MFIYGRQENIQSTGKKNINIEFKVWKSWRQGIELSLFIWNSIFNLFWKNKQNTDRVNYLHYLFFEETSTSLKLRCKTNYRQSLYTNIKKFFILSFFVHFLITIWKYRIILLMYQVNNVYSLLEFKQKPEQSFEPEITPA